MKKKVVEFIRHPLIFGSSILFVGSLTASILNYIFNLSAGRLLSVEDYGTFASLISLFNIFSVFSVVILMVFSKFSASLVGQKKEKVIGSLFISGTIWVAMVSLFLCLVLSAFSFYIADFLRIDNVSLIFITIGSLFFSFLAAAPTGILQGLLKFKYYSFANILSSAAKLLLGVLFISLGYRVLGVISAFFLSTIVSYIFVLAPLYKFIKQKSDEGFTLSSLHKKVYVYALPVLMSNIGMTALASLDIILVKHYFDSSVAGQYAALSLMGRSIFYLVSPIASVLFPLIAQKRERKESLIGTLVLSLGLIGIPSAILSIVYFIFPDLILRIFFPASTYSSLSPYLGPFSLFVLFYSLSFLLNSFYLSIGKVRVFFLTLIAAILEAVLIVFFHSSITQIIFDILLSAFLLLISLLIYYRNVSKDTDS